MVFQALLPLCICFYNNTILFHMGLFLASKNVVEKCVLNCKELYKCRYKHYQGLKNLQFFDK